jgi:hypothetical protein
MKVRPKKPYPLFSLFSIRCMWNNDPLCDVSVHCASRAFVQNSKCPVMVKDDLRNRNSSSHGNDDSIKHDRHHDNVDEEYV